MRNELGLIAFENCKKFGEQVDGELQRLSKNVNDKSFLVPIEQVRFNNGEGKIVIKETIREKDVYVLSDIGNHSCTYRMYDYKNHMSPDDHCQDIKRVISAMGGNADKMTLITPLLYASRQHKRKGRESLDCAMYLQELQALGVEAVITFDAHDPNVQNAIHNLSFENFYPTYLMLDEFIDNEDINIKNLQFVSPDAGAIDRARYYADLFNSDVGTFYKRRDLSVISDGRHPIVTHKYMGDNVKGKDVVVVDDMIASGDSILETCAELKKRGAKNIYVFSTFAFFTKGTNDFEEAYLKKNIKKIYTTNLSYVQESTIKKEWLKQVNCAPFVATIIDALHNQKSLTPLLNGREKVLTKIIDRKTH